MQITAFPSTSAVVIRIDNLFTRQNESSANIKKESSPDVNMGSSANAEDETSADVEMENSKEIENEPSPDSDNESSADMEFEPRTDLCNRWTSFINDVSDYRMNRSEDGNITTLTLEKRAILAFQQIVGLEGLICLQNILGCLQFDLSKEGFFSKAAIPLFRVPVLADDPDDWSLFTPLFEDHDKTEYEGFIARHLQWNLHRRDLYICNDMSSDQLNALRATVGENLPKRRLIWALLKHHCGLDDSQQEKSKNQKYAGKKLDKLVNFFDCGVAALALVPS